MHSGQQIHFSSLLCGFVRIIKSKNVLTRNIDLLIDFKSHKIYFGEEFVVPSSETAVGIVNRNTAFINKEEINALPVDVQLGKRLSNQFGLA